MNPFEGYIVPEGFTTEEELFKNKKYLVFRASNSQTGKPVTLKSTRSAGGGLYDVSKLSHEYNILKNLDHPGLLKAIDLIPAGKMITMATEWFEGESLKEHIARGRISLAKFFEIAIQLAEVVQYIHNAGIIHRDINP